MEKITVNSTWYRFIELRDQKWVEFKQGKMPIRDPRLEKFCKKFQHQTPWGVEELEDTSEEGKVGKVIQEALKEWNLDSTAFYPQMKDKLRQNHDSCNSKMLKQTYQSAVKMAASAPKNDERF